MAAPKTLPPKEVRTARSRKGGRASATPEAQIKRALGTIAARAQHLTDADLARAAEVIASAPTITAEQAERLRALLPPAQ